MLLLAHPSDEQVDRFLARACQSRFTYAEVGATSGPMPAHFNVDHHRVQLGFGSETWDKAVAAIRSWQMFNLGWISLYSPSIPIEVGQNVAVLAHFSNCYWLNACRIVYVVEESEPLQRFGFAYGTLEEHAESGEERFMAEWNHETGEVWYDILAFSRPHHLLTRIGYPFARRLQKRFATGSKHAMMKAVGTL